MQTSSSLRGRLRIAPRDLFGREFLSIPAGGKLRRTDAVWERFLLRFFLSERPEWRPETDRSPPEGDRMSRRVNRDRAARQAEILEGSPAQYIPAYRAPGYPTLQAYVC